MHLIELPMQDAQVSGTPRGVFTAESKTLKPLMNIVHGHALATAALLVASARSVPYSLISSIVSCVWHCKLEKGIAEDFGRHS